MGKRLIGAVEAGGTKFVVALAREDGEVLVRDRLPTLHPDQTMPAMAAFFAQAQSDHGAIAAFGIASFGPVDIDPVSRAYGTITTTPKPGWSGIRYHDALSAFGVPVVVDSDVNGAALGEFLAGAGQGCRTLAYTTIGTGIGTGIVQDGRTMRGLSHYETGHITAPRAAGDDFAGICPFHCDCLEGMTSGPAIERRFGASLDRLGPAEIELAAGYIAHLAATLVLTHMPDRLIFGGGVMKAPGLVAAVRRRTEQGLGGYIRHSRLDPGLVDYIVTPGLGDDAGITGAIALGRSALSG